MRAAPAVDGIKGLEDFDLGVGDGVGEVFGINLVDVSLAVVIVKALNVVLHAILNIDGLLVQRGEGAREVRLADHARLVRVVDDHKVVRGNGAQAESVGGIALRDPMPAVLGVVQKAGLLEVLAKPPEVERAELLVFAQAAAQRRRISGD